VDPFVLPRVDRLPALARRAVISPSDLAKRLRTGLPLASAINWWNADAVSTYLSTLPNHVLRSLLGQRV